MASVTYEEKRLKSLKQQLFGKEQPLSFKVPNNYPQEIKNSSDTPAITSTSLKKDLYKIIILSFIALATQFSLFLAIQNGLIKLF